MECVYYYYWQTPWITDNFCPKYWQVKRGVNRSGFVCRAITPVVSNLAGSSGRLPPCCDRRGKQPGGCSKTCHGRPWGSGHSGRPCHANDTGPDEQGPQGCARVSHLPCPLSVAYLWTVCHKAIGNIVFDSMPQTFRKCSMCKSYSYLVLLCSQFYFCGVA